VARETSFVFTVDADPETDAVLSRHAGASRFAFNQCLSGVKAALDERDKSPQAFVPWSGFDLINYFNAWKASEAGGRRRSRARTRGILKVPPGTAKGHPGWVPEVQEEG
jgi:putative transposase